MFPGAAQKSRDRAVAAPNPGEQVGTGKRRTLKASQRYPLGGESVGRYQIAANCNAHGAILLGPGFSADAVSFTTNPATISKSTGLGKSAIAAQQLRNLLIDP
jgi:hypothetical protein